MLETEYSSLTHCGLGDFNEIWALFKPITMIDGWDVFCEIALRRMSLNLTDDKSTLVQVMAWCRQAPSHYLSQCWPRSLSPYDVTRPQWIGGKFPSKSNIISAMIWILGQWNFFGYVEAWVWIHFMINSLCAKFLRGNINMYLYFMSFLHTDMPKMI